MTAFSETLHFPTSTSGITLSGVRLFSDPFGSLVRTKQNSNRDKNLEAGMVDGFGLTRASRMRILSVGDDEVLLNTRRMVLESAGFLVSCMSSFGTIEEAEVRAIDLALICHSVNEDRAEATVRVLKEINPPISVLQLCKGYCSRRGDVEQSAAFGPRQMLMEIERILREKFKASNSGIHAVPASPTI